MMTAKNMRIAYWIVTLLFAAPQVWSALEYLREAPPMTATILGLGYPVYFMKMLGIAKLLGVAAIINTRFPTLKEWAYAGFTFEVLGAFVSHVSASDPAYVAAVPLAFLAVQLASYALWRRLRHEPRSLHFFERRRPAGRAFATRSA